MYLLYVDDEDAVLEITRIFLERDTRIDEVFTTKNPSVALEYALSDEVDAIISDYEMPTKDGLTLLREIRSQGSDIPFILFTGKGREGLVIEAIDSGADFYVQKGGDPRSQFTELLHKTQKAVDGRRHKREASTFSEIVKTMDNGLMIIRLDEDDPLSSPLEMTNAAAQRIIGDPTLPTRGCLRDLNGAGMASAVPHLISCLSGMEEGGITEHMGNVEVTGGDGTIKHLEMDILPLSEGRFGILFKDVTEVCVNERLKAEEEERVRIQRQAALGLVMDEAVSTAEIPTAFHLITEKVRDCLDVSKVSILLVNDGSLETVSVNHAYENLRHKAGADLTTAISILDELGIKNMLRIDDTGDCSANTSELCKKLHSQDVRSVLATGLKVEGGLMGVLLVENIGGPRKWHNDEEAFVGNISALTGQMMTVREKKRLIQKSHHYSYLLKQVVENSKFAIAVHDRDMRYLYVSDRYREEYGLQGVDVIGRHHYEVVPHLPQELREVHKRVLQGSREGRDVDVFTHPDGRSNYTRWECVPWYSGDGRIGGLVVYTEFIDKYIEGQQNLRRSEELLRLISDNLWENINILDMDLNFTFVSNNIEKLRGYTVDEAMSQSLEDIFESESLGYVRDTLEMYLEKDAKGEIDPHGVHTFEALQRHKDGHSIEVEIKAGFIRNDEGRPVGILTLTRDITESNRAEKDLEKVEERYSTILAASGLGAWEHKVGIGGGWRSPGFYTMLGYDYVPALDMSSEGPDGPWTNLIHPDDVDRAKSTLEEYVRNGTGSYECKFRMRRADGTWAHILSRGRRLEDDPSSPSQTIYGVHIDISREMDIKEGLLETTSRLEDIIDNLPDPTMVISIDGKIWHWNRALEELTGVTKSEMLGKGDFEYALPFYGTRRPMLADIAIGSSENDELYDCIERMGDTLVTDDVNVWMNGRKHLLWAMARPLKDIRGNVIGVIESIRDVTDRKHVEEYVRRLNRQLNLMSSITRHDVLNQTTALKGFLGLMKDDVSLRNDKHINMLSSIAERISGLIEFTRIYDEIGSKDPIWLSLKELAPSIDEVSGIDYICEVEDIEVFADPLIKRIFDNLLDNSLRHGEGVTRLRVHHTMEDGVLKVLWEDDGQGIPRSDKEIIFERGQGKNTGLGLNISRDILSITEMSIVETGTPGEGARFEIHVPEGRYRFSCPVDDPR